MNKIRPLILSLLFIGVTSTVFAEEPRIPVGMILPLSGDFAVIGSDCKQGIDLALREFGGGAPIDLIYGDSKGDPMTAVGEFRKLAASDHVAGVFAFRGPVGMALNPIARQAKIPLLGGVGNKSFAASSSYAFQIWAPSDAEGSFIAVEMLRRGHKTVALVTTEDDWTVSVSDSFRSAFQAGGGKVLTDQSLSAKDGDYRTLITQIKKSNPESIFVNLGIAQIGPFLRQLKEQGIGKPVFSNFWSAKKDVLSVAGDAAEGVLFSEMSLAEMPKFQKEIAAAGGGHASGATLSAYVATKLLLQAAQALKSDRSSTALYQALLAQPSVVLTDLSLKIKDRVVEFPLVMKVIKDGRSVPSPF